MWGAPKDVKGYDYNLEKAKEYLAKVKEPMREITIGALAGYGQTEQAAAMLQVALTKRSAIKGQNRCRAVAGCIEERCAMKSRCMTCSSCGSRLTMPIPNNWVGEMYDCDQIGQRNNSWYCNKEVNKLLDEAQKTTDQKVRSANYAKAATMVMNDAAGIFVYNTKWFGPFNAKVKGVRFSPIGNGQEMRWVYFE